VKREIIVNVTHDEIRIAILDNHILIDFFTERLSYKNVLNNIYKGKVQNIIPALNAAFVSIECQQNAYLHINKPYNIDIGQELLVQVNKEAIGSKCPKITRNIIIPGRFLIYIPFGVGITISKKIKGNNRAILLNLMIKLQKLISTQGKFILRTSSQKASSKEIEEELHYLINIWRLVLYRFKYIHSSTSLLYEDFNIVIKAIRDYYSNQISIIHIDSKKLFLNTINYLKVVKSQLYNKVVLYTNNNTSIFKTYNIEKDINKLYSKKIELNSGGYLIIEELEYITVIDVNSGKFISTLIQEDTALQTNLEATKEIARQIRLRNIGGIIIIDFIDMKKIINRQVVFNKLRNYTKTDKVKTKVYPITHLGLIEMTRERKRKSLLSCSKTVIYPRHNEQNL
jgi:ribonuclease G